MSCEWNYDYQDEIATLDNFFLRLLPTWQNIGEIDFTKERPERLDRLNEVTDELVDALGDFMSDMERINEDND